MIYNLGAGYYTTYEMCKAISGSIAINENNQAYVISENVQSVDLSGASDIANILKLEGFLTPPAISDQSYEDIDEIEYDEDGHAFSHSNSEIPFTFFNSHLLHFGL